MIYYVRKRGYRWYACAHVGAKLTLDPYFMSYSEASELARFMNRLPRYVF